MPFRAKKKEETPEEKADTKRRNRELLPWRTEQKLSACLNPCKIPLVVVVCMLGIVVEDRFNNTTTELWRAKPWRDGPVCYVHRIRAFDAAAKNVTVVPRSVQAFVNKTLIGFVTSLSGDPNRTQFNLDGPVLFNYSKEECGVYYNDAEGECTVGPLDEHGEFKEHDYVEGLDGGINQQKIPFLYFSLLWAIYKVMFLPIHWPDRIVRFATGDDCSEPVFKVISEPTTKQKNVCCETFFKIGKMIRTSLLPNGLILPFVTMDRLHECTDIYHYKMDRYLSIYIYYICLIDLLLICVGTVIGYSKMWGDRCLGTFPYRMYMCYAAFTFPGCFILWILDVFFVLDYRFWKGLFVGIQVMLKVDVSYTFTFAIDVTSTLGGCITVLDNLQFVIMVITLLCPQLLAKVPILSDIIADEKKQEQAETDAEAALIAKGEAEEAGDDTSPQE